MDPEEKDFKEKLAERFAQLPKVVQDAITSADVEKHLRALADTHKLHLDQWEKLENEVMLALLGFQRSEDLQKNIESEVGIDAATAALLATSISTVVFGPIRQELERQLEHPDAVAKATSGVEDMRASILADASESQPVAGSLKPVDTGGMPVASSQQPVAETGSPDSAASYQPQTTSSVAPATPPAPAPTLKVERAPATPPSYVSAPSHERKTVEGDPYREQLD